MAAQKKKPRSRLAKKKPVQVQESVALAAPVQIAPVLPQPTSEPQQQADVQAATPAQDAVSPESQPQTEKPFSEVSDITDPIMPEEDGESPMKKIFLWLSVLLLLLVIIGGISYVSYGMGVKKGEENAKQAQSAQPTVEPTVKPLNEEVAVDKGAYEINVLNGSGISGEAAKVQNILEEEGFAVLSIGNAKGDDIDETIIEAKQSVDKNFIKVLKEFLMGTYAVGDVSELDDDADEDVIVTVGKQKAEE